MDKWITLSFSLFSIKILSISLFPCSNNNTQRSIIWRPRPTTARSPRIASVCIPTTVRICAVGVAMSRASSRRWRTVAADSAMDVVVI